jgi:hypothetical protein
VRSVALGLEQGADVEAPRPFAHEGRVVFYGTSITQGGCACRPGMLHSNILSRELDVEFVNLGFSGNGKGEPEVARLVAEIDDPCLYILSYEANCPSTEHLERTLRGFIPILREKQPDVPILIISRVAFAKDLLLSGAMAQRIRQRDLQRGVVEEFRSAGDAHVHFLDGGELLGDDFDECTVDGVHPTDLGFRHLAQGMLPVVKRLLGQTA